VARVRIGKIIGVLVGARRELSTAGAQKSVTEVAVHDGFTHLGRFTEAYRRAYGESPSETLRRARATCHADGD